MARVSGLHRITSGLAGTRVRVPAVVSEPKIGLHGCRAVGDMVELDVRGELTVADVEALQELIVEIRGREGLCYGLIDLTGMTALSAAARRKVAIWVQADGTGLTGSALYGCSFAMRALITLTLNAVRVMSRVQLETTFVNDEAMGRAWIDAHRAAERAKQAGRPST